MAHREPWAAPPREACARGERLAWTLALIVLLLRLLTLPLYPLCDRTESRYGEMARAMAASGDLVTPRLGGEPFWGKPPLATWAQAAGVALLGRSAWAVRLPAWLALVLAAWLVLRSGRLLGGPRVGRLAFVVYATSPLVLVLAGGVMTDPFLGLGVALALHGALRGRLGEASMREAWTAGVLLGAGAAVAVLAKGPIGLVFAGTPAVVALRAGHRRHLLVAGALCTVLAVPWFVLAEVRTPGFLAYFLVGEHVQRFLDPQWAGDRYGGAHPMPRGTVWLYAAAALLPWVPLVVARLRATRWGRSLRNPATRMLVASALVPLVLFTLARGLLPTYPLPALGAIALLLGRDLATARGGGADVGGRSLAWVPRGVTLSLAFVVGVLLALPARSWTPVCHEAMVRATAGRVPVYARPLTFLYSARFYSDGRAREAPDVDAPVWDDVRAQPSAFAVLVKEGRDAAVPHDLRPRLRREGVVGGTYAVHAVAPWDGAP